MAHNSKSNKSNGKEAGQAGSGAASPHSEAACFEIRVQGQLDSRWSEWLDGLEVSCVENGEMILFGSIVDQAALVGILNKLARLNLTILAVNKVQKV